MIIEVATNKNDPPKKKGDLLEKIAKNLFELQNYEVENEIRNTGIELDLLCKDKANASKKIYIECKAYNEKAPIPAEVIAKLHGIKGIKKYYEAWLISTSQLTKDAEGLVGEF